MPFCIHSACLHCNMFQSDVYYSFLLFGFLKLLKRHMSSKENSSGFCVVIVAKETISFSLQCMGHLCHIESATERHLTLGIESEGGRNINEQNGKNSRNRTPFK